MCKSFTRQKQDDAERNPASQVCGWWAGTSHRHGCLGGGWEMPAMGGPAGSVVQEVFGYTGLRLADLDGFGACRRDSEG